MLTLPGHSQILAVLLLAHAQLLWFPMASDDAERTVNRQELPAVSVTTTLASQVADVYSLGQDLAMVAFWCRQVDVLVSTDEAGDEKTSVLALGLWRAALITYRRCWTHSPSAVSAGLARMRPLDDWLDQVGLGHARDTHEVAMAQANRNVAHQVDDSEQFAVSVFLNPPGERRDVVAAGVMGAILLVPTDGRVGRLADLAEALSTVIDREVERGYQQLIEQGRDFGIDKLYTIADGGNQK